MYTPLKITTDYTLLKSLIKIDDLILFLVTNNIKACAICDENLFGWAEFYTKCKQNNIKPIIGLNIKVTNQDVYLYAKNYNGFKNMLKLHTIMQKKELEVSDLIKYYQDILVIIPESSYSLKNVLTFYDDLYFCYQNEEEEANLKSEKNKIYLNDIKALKKEDLIYLNYLDLLAERKKNKYQNNFYNEHISDSAIVESIISKLNLELPKDKNYIPAYHPQANQFLKALAQKGLEKRLNKNITSIYQNRLNYELDVITKMGFGNYFLIVYDYVLYAKKNNILVNCRGSAAGSLVSFCLGITDVDPIKYNLIFERFLNPERITMPDIDIDFAADKREEVIKYVKNKYGVENVAKGLTFTTLKTKLVLRDLAKVLNINNYVFEKFNQNIDGNLSLKANLKNELIQKYLNNYQDLKKLYKIALKLENLKKNVSTHAAGIVISSCPLDEVIPIFYNGDELITGISMEYLENLGLLKMDFLGLKNLTTISNVLKVVGLLKMPDINYEDQKVFQIFNTIDVEGIFQFETNVMRHFLENFKIDTFKDLVAALALIRPGPKDYIMRYNRRRKKIDKITYLHPDLAPILEETYGIILYQEQIMAILNKIGGYSLGEADLIRRAIAKKKENIIKEEKAKFVNRATKRGYKSEVANLIYDDIAKFADYGFNKSHSVTYAKLSYEMAYLKAYYYDYFLLVLLNSDSKNQINKYLSILKKRHLQIVKPSILNTNLECVIKDKKLYLPLTLIGKINKEIINKLALANKKNYTDFIDFCLKTKDFISRDCLSILIKSGALDIFKLNHPTMLENLDNILNYVSLVEEDEDIIPKPSLVIKKDLTEKEKLREEKEVYGFYVTHHPAAIYQDKNIVKAIDITKWLFKKINMGLLITKITKIKTKKNEDMAFLEAEDETGKVSLTVFPMNFKALDSIKEKDLVILRGEVSKRFDKYQIIVNNIKKDGENNE